jgi:hypothetical protein
MKDFAMSRDEDDDLYDEEFDFVDDEDDELEADDRSDIDEVVGGAKNASVERDIDRNELDDEPVDEYGRPQPKADYVVHVYEYNKFKRTIDRPFTPEDAEAFATEFNRTSKAYGRTAVTGKNDFKPKKTLD